jgi:hypothetical protein
MNKLQGITPVLARTVLVVAMLTTVLSVVTAVAVEKPSIFMFTCFSLVSGLYARKVLRHEKAVAPVEALDHSVTRLAA